MAYPAYRPTPARAAALKRAQAASAAKRRGKGKGKLAVANKQLAKYSKRRSNIKKAAKYTAYGVTAVGAAVAAKQGVSTAKKYHGRFQAVTARHNAQTAKNHVMLRGHYQTQLARKRSVTHGLPTGHSMAGRNIHNRHHGVVINQHGGPGY